MASMETGRSLAPSKTGSRARPAPVWKFQEGCTFQPRCGLRTARPAHATTMPWHLHSNASSRLCSRIMVHRQRAGACSECSCPQCSFVTADADHRRSGPYHFTVAHQDLDDLDLVGRPLILIPHARRSALRCRRLLLLQSGLAGRGLDRGPAGQGQQPAILGTRCRLRSASGGTQRRRRRTLFMPFPSPYPEPPKRGFANKNTAVALDPGGGLAGRAGFGSRGRTRAG